MNMEGEADKGTYLHHDPNSLVGASESPAETPHKWRQDGSNNLCRRVEDALSTSPQGTGPLPRCPRGCWAGFSGSSYICREAGGHCEATVCRVQELLFQRVLFEDPHCGLLHLPLQDPTLPSKPPKGSKGHL